MWYLIVLIGLIFVGVCLWLIWIRQCEKDGGSGFMGAYESGEIPRTERGSKESSLPAETSDDYDRWLLNPGEEYVRIPMAGTHMVIASTISPDDLLSGNFQTGQWINFIVGYPPIGSPAFEIGGVVQKSRMIEIAGEPVRETMLTDEKNGRRLLLLLGVIINKQAANLMVTGVQKRALL